MNKAEFLKVQYVPDLLRDEPVNVGVVVRRAGEVAARFLGEVEPGHLDGRRLKSFASTSAYTQWVTYWRRVLESDLDDPLQELVETSGEHFRVIPGGEVAEIGDDPTGQVLDYLFSLLVSGGFAEAIRSAAEEAGAVAEASLERDIETELRRLSILAVGEAEMLVRYPVVRRPAIPGRQTEQPHRPAYAQFNGRLDVIESIDLTGHGRARVKDHAGWMAYMFEDIREARQSRGEESRTIAVVRWTEEAAQDEDRLYARSLVQAEANEVIDWWNEEERAAFLEERYRIAIGNAPAG